MRCVALILHSFAIFVFPHKFVGISSDETEKIYDIQIISNSKSYYEIFSTTTLDYWKN